MKKRIIAIFLVVAMLVSAVPLGAFSAEIPSEQTSMDTGEVSIEGTNGFGTLLSQEIAESREENAKEAQDYQAGYTVTDLVIEGTTATVTYDSLEEALLVVALYTEDGMRMVTSATSTVTAGATEAMVEFTGEMPEYFLASAYLMDTYDLSPLCAAYDTPMYTREMQELLASTVEDYDADRVLNLDDDNTTNFAVYAETTKVIEAVEGVNTVASVDDENATYVIENADESIISLQVGDVFAFPYEPNNLLIVKIAEITVNGTTVTIVGDDLELEECFSHVKIESASDTSDAVVTDLDPNDGITYEGLSYPEESEYGTYAWEGDASLDGSHYFGVEKTFQNSKETAEVTIKGGLEASFELKVDYYVSWTRQYVKVTLDVDVGLFINVDGSISTNFKNFAEFKIGPVKGVTILLKPKIDIEFSGELNFQAGIHLPLGFSFENGKGFRNISSIPMIETELDVEGKFFIGVDLNPTITVVSKYVASAKAEIPVGVEIGAELTGTDFDEVLIGPDSVGPSIHTCERCLDITIAIKAELAVELKFLNSDYLKVEDTFEIAPIEFPFYWSVTNSDFGSGECPYEAFRITVNVLDAAQMPISDATVKANTVEDQTNYWGNAYIYLPAGTYSIEASFGELTKSKSVTVDETQKVIITLFEETEENVSFGGILEEIDSEKMADWGSVLASGSCTDGTNWAFHTSGVLHIFGIGSIKDYFFDAQWREYLDQTKQIVVSEGITSIGACAFNTCPNLTKVTLPDSLTSIGEFSFGGCPELMNVTIPDNVTSIGNNAFAGCSSFQSITIPDSVISLGEYAFYSCSGLTSVIIGDGLTSINKHVFEGCNNLANLVIGDGDTTIDEDAFYNHDNLKSVTIGNGAVTIGNLAFASCENLSNVTIGGNASIGPSAFRNCPSLINIEISDAVTNIGDFAFYLCSSLDSITLPENVTTIGNYAFGNCYELTRVTLPESLATIADCAFIFCYSLSDVYYYGTEAQWEEIHIGADNESLTNATIHYNSTGPLVDTGAPIQALSVGRNGIAEDMSEAVKAEVDKPIISPNAVYPGDYSTEVTDTDILKTASFTGLVPGEQYILLAMKSIETEDPLAADNLLFIDQSAALVDGTLAFQYVQRETADISYVVACGASNKNLKDAEITLPEMLADVELQVVDPTVVYDGVTLTEGRDYVIVGTVDFTEEGTYTCYIRGVHNYTGLVECTYTVSGAPEFTVTYTSASISLAGDIGVNYYAQLSDNIVADENAYMQFTVAGQTQTVPLREAEVSADGTYRFSCKVAAKQMTEDITGQIYLADGTAVGDPKIYSVKAYCDAAIPVYSQDADHAELVALMKAMLNYGGYTQAQLSYNTDNLANAGMDTTLPAITAVDMDAFAHGATGSESGISVASVSLLLESTTTIRFYFELDGSKSIDEYTFYVDGVETTPVAAENGQYYVDKVNVAAKDLDEMVTVTVGGLTVKYCGLSYVRQVAVLYPDHYSEALVNVAKALCAYNQAANAYFA